MVAAVISRAAVAAAAPAAEDYYAGIDPEADRLDVQLGELLWATRVPLSYAQIWCAAVVYSRVVYSVRACSTQMRL